MKTPESLFRSPFPLTFIVGAGISMDGLIQQYAQYFANLVDVSQFETAKSIVESCFSFIPE